MSYCPVSVQGQTECEIQLIGHVMCETRDFLHFPAVMKTVSFRKKYSWCKDISVLLLGIQCVQKTQNLTSAVYYDTWDRINISAWARLFLSYPLLPEWVCVCDWLQVFGWLQVIQGADWFTSWSQELKDRLLSVPGGSPRSAWLPACLIMCKNVFLNKTI